MIESKGFLNTTIFTGETQLLSSFFQFNYLLGSNGTGKTTISKLIT